MRTIGILGGLGPLAGAHFYRRIVEMSPAMNDQEHIPIILISDPAIPNRVTHLSGNGESPVPKLKEVCKNLVNMGAQTIAVPSSTTSIYLNELQAAVDVPIISLIDVVTDEIVAAGCEQVGIMATTPTRTLGVYDEAFVRHSIRAVYPDSRSEREIMQVIKTVKGSPSLNACKGYKETRDFDLLGQKLREIVSRPWTVGVDAILLGCTELPVVFSGLDNTSQLEKSLSVFNSTDILAARVVMLAYGLEELC